MIINLICVCCRREPWCWRRCSRLTAPEQEVHPPKWQLTALLLVASSRTGDGHPRSWVCNRFLYCRQVYCHPDLQAKKDTCLFSASDMLCFVFLLFIPFSVPPAANMNVPHGDASATSANLSNAVLSSKVSELVRVSVGLGMAPPEFSYIGNRQVTACIAIFTSTNNTSKIYGFSRGCVCVWVWVVLMASVSTGTSSVSGEAVQWLDGSRSTVPIRKWCQGESCLLCSPKTGTTHMWEINHKSLFQCNVNKWIRLFRREHNLMKSRMHAK